MQSRQAIGRYHFDRKRITIGKKTVFGREHKFATIISEIFLHLLNLSKCIWSSVFPATSFNTFPGNLELPDRACVTSIVLISIMKDLINLNFAP